MFVLLYGEEYRGFEVLGVYGSQDRAVEAGLHYSERDDVRLTYGRWIEVQRLELDRPASDNFLDRNALWALSHDEGVVA